MELQLIKAATEECWEIIRSRMSPSSEYDYSTYCENMETVIREARKQGKEIDVVCVTAQAFELMLTDMGATDECGKELTKFALAVKKAGLVQLEKDLQDAARAAGFEPRGPRPDWR